MAPTAAAPLRRQLDLKVFEQTVSKIFDIFDVEHDVKTADGEAVDLDMDVRHVLNHLLAEQEALFRQWQFEEIRHCEERLFQLDRSWQRRCKVMQRGSIRSVETPPSLEPEKAKEVEVEATKEQTNTAAQDEARQKTAVEEEARRRAAEEEAKRLAAEDERKQVSEEEDAGRNAAEENDNARSCNLDFNSYAKAEGMSAKNTASFTASFKEPTEEHQPRQNSAERLALEITCRTESGTNLEATPSRKDDASKRGYPLTSSTPATSPSKSPLISARGPPASPAFTPKPLAESPGTAKPRGVVSEGIARLMGKFTGGSR